MLSERSTVASKVANGLSNFQTYISNECLNIIRFWNLRDAQRKISARQLDYTSERQHSPLSYRIPAELNRAWLEQAGK